MKDEVARILGMLEGGAIGAAEAERLIRAIAESAGNKRGDWRERRQKRREELRSALNGFCEALRIADRKRRRYLVWCAHLRRFASAARREARRNEPVLDRLRAVLRENAICDGVAESSARLADLLDSDPIGWSNLRFGLELEFERPFTLSELETCETVEDLAKFLSDDSAPTEEAPPRRRTKPSTSAVPDPA